VNPASPSDDFSLTYNCLHWADNNRTYNDRTSQHSDNKHSGGSWFMIGTACCDYLGFPSFLKYNHQPYRVFSHISAFVITYVMMCVLCT